MIFESKTSKWLKKLKKVTSMRLAKRTVGIDRKQHYALKDELGHITFTWDEVIKVAEEFYRKLYSSNDRQTRDTSMETTDIEVPCINTSETKKSSKSNEQRQRRYRWLIDWRNQLCRQFSTRQTRSIFFFYQMLAKLLYTKYLEKTL